MPARRRTAGSDNNAVSSPNSDNDKDDAYKIKRKRNNDAVKKTREKSKKTARERKENVEKLRIKNTQLETQIEERKKNVEGLKQLLLHKMDPKEQEEMVKHILEESPECDDDDDDE